MPRESGTDCSALETVIPVQAIENGWVLIRPAGSDVPGERVSRSCVVRSSEARTYLKRMTEEAPSPDAWANYAEFLERTDRVAAFDCLVKAVKLQFNHQRVHILMGRAFEQAGMTPEAENSFKAAEHLGEQFWFRFERERDSLSHEHQFPIRHPDVHWPPPQTLEATAFCGLGFTTCGLLATMESRSGIGLSKTFVRPCRKIAIVRPPGAGWPKPWKPRENRRCNSGAGRDYRAEPA